jgi:hypothetical protein
MDNIDNLELKILHWMMKGIQEVSQVYRSLEPQLLTEASEQKYKDIFKVINEYFQKYKTPPSYELLVNLVSMRTRSIVYDIESETCLESEIGFYLDAYKKSFNLRIAEKLVKTIIDLSEDELTTIDLAEMCYESQEQLIDRLINIANWYAERYNELA